MSELATYELGKRQLPTTSPDDIRTAQKSADFLFFDGDNLLKPEVDDTISVANPNKHSIAHHDVREMLLAGNINRGELIESIFELHNHMSGILDEQNDWHRRREFAVRLASSYREDLSGSLQGLSYDQRSAIEISKMYLSSVESLARLGQYVFSKFWLAKSSTISADNKLAYLESRKNLQEDVDSFINQFKSEPKKIVHEVLEDTICMARLLVNKRKWTNALLYEFNHQFIGSVLSERAVMVSLQENGFPLARYGTAEEDKSPTKADVVVPLDSGDMHVQVKMKWTRPTELDIQDGKTPMHVIVPMHQIRSNLTRQEDQVLASSVRTVADKLAA